jgi:hypothetical protein
MRRLLLASLAGVAAVALTGAAHAAVITYAADLNGPSESPPNASPGSGEATVIVDDVLNTMRVKVSFAGLLGTTTASHIHCCTALADTGTAPVATQVPTFTGFPLGVTAGTYDNTFDLLLDSTYNSSFEGAHGGTAATAEAALLAGLAANEAYLNIHTTIVPGGEIRGFLQAVVPEPATWATMILGLGLAGLSLRRRRVLA